MSKESKPSKEGKATKDSPAAVVDMQGTELSLVDTTSCKIVETLSVKNDFFMKNTSWLTKETGH